MSINVSNMKSMRRFMTVFICMLTEVLVLKLVEAMMAGYIIMFVVNLDSFGQLKLCKTCESIAK